MDRSDLKPRIGQLVKSDDSLTENDGETAEVHNNFSVSVHKRVLLYY